MSDHGERAHARLSASGSKRWIRCPGSPRLVESLPAVLRRGSSRAANLGTAAHVLIEECVRLRLADSRSFRGAYITLDGRILRKPADPEQGFEVDDAMMAGVDVMLDVVWAEGRRLGAAAELRSECKFDLSWLRPNMFGTGDIVWSLFLEELVVIDYKNGGGVVVEVAEPGPDGVLHGNPQLLYYALGVAALYDFTHERVKLILVQPNAPHEDGSVRVYMCTMAELLEFRDHLAEAVDRVLEADGEFPGEATPEWSARWLSAGDHCASSFCDAVAVCPSLRDLAQEAAGADFDDEPPGRLLTDRHVADLARSLRWVPVLDARNRAIEAMALRLAMQGVRLDGFKLVRKRSVRRWEASPEVVAARLRAVGLTDGQFMAPPKLLSPAKVEKLGKDARKLVNGHRLTADGTWQVEPLAHKPPGGLTLAPRDDPRDEATVDPAADFDDGDEGDED